MLNKKTILITIFLPICFIVLATQLLTTKAYLMISEPFYGANDNFEEYSGNDLGVCDAYIDVDYEHVADRIMGYLNYRYDTLQTGSNEDSDLGIFTPKEIRHMEDVKNIFTAIRIVFVVGIIIVILNSWYLLKKDRNLFHYAINRIWIWPLVFSLIMGSMFLIDFDETFTLFHKIAFNNDDYILPTYTTLIIVLPINFWLVSGSLIILLLIVFIVITRIINNKFWKEVK